jgi:hypothetical protein
MAGHSRPKDGVASLAYDPAIHAFLVAKPKTGCGVDRVDKPGFGPRAKPRRQP